MDKRIASLLLALLLLAGTLPSALAEEDPFPLTETTMYVYTENGGRLNVRSEPKAADNNVIGKLDYGAKVTAYGNVPGIADWMIIEYKKAAEGVAFVMSRYLVETKPKDADKRAEEAAEKKSLEELNRELASAVMYDAPRKAVVRASRASGFVNFRVGPATSTERISSLPDGRQLKLMGETSSWYLAVDTETDRSGYIYKDYVTAVTAAPSQTLVMPQQEKNEKESLGTLNVNGSFTIQCKLPTGYELQTVNVQGSKIYASVFPSNKQKPMLYLTIAYDELYSDVERMNDLSEESLQALEASFTQMNDVEITYRETAYGTKLLIVKEVGEDTDFVDILSVYKGYFVEFIMTPNPEAKSQTLTEKQIAMCIDFLSEVDFIPAK